MGQIPDRQCARRMRGRGESAHVVAASGAVIDLGQHDHRGVAIDAVRDIRGFGQTEDMPGATQRRQALRHIEVGREIAGVREDRAALRPQRERGGEQLEEVHRGRVGDQHLAGRGADEARDLVAESPRQIDPAGLVPACDEILSPVLRDAGRDPPCGRARQGTKRVAVEVDDVVGEREIVAMPGQGVGVVEGFAGGAVDGHRIGLQGANRLRQGSGIAWRGQCAGFGRRSGPDFTRPRCALRPQVNRSR
jgi:hypothetical protein